MRKISIIFAALAFTLASCEKDDLLELKQSTRQTDKTELIDEIHEGEIQLGDKYENPLLLKNMQRAADTLSKRSGLRNAVILEPTHLYVRFLPKDSAEYEQLVADTVLDVTPYPLDYELTEGTVYHDKSLPYDSYQWQYAVVPIDYDLSSVGIHSEKLEELYMPDGILDEEDEDNTGALRSTSVSPSSEFSLSQLLTEAERQTEKVTSTLKSKWRPGATIKAYDNVVGGMIPLRGVKVRICVLGFIKTHKYTDENGNVSFSKRRRRASYSIEWEDDKWDIRDKGTQAYYNGPRLEKWWNLSIGMGTQKSLHYSAIHRALYEYYYGDNCGFSRPSKSLKISYREGSDPDGKASGSTTQACVRTWGWIASPIKIYGTSVYGGKYSVSSVLHTTLHELTHASHILRMNKSSYEKVKKYIRESWADFASWKITTTIYMRLGNSGEPEYFIKNTYQDQKWDYKSGSSYSPLFIDLYDNYNQYNKNNPTLYPNDKVYGFSIPLLDKNLCNFKNISDVEAFVKRSTNKPYYVNLNQITDLINFYKRVWKE